MLNTSNSSPSRVFTPGSALFSKIAPETHVPRLVSIWSHPLIERLAPIMFPRGRSTAALTAARELDRSLGLPIAQTVVRRRDSSRYPSPPAGSDPPSSEIYDHTNFSNWENELITTTALAHSIMLGFRAFMDSFYGKLGFRPIWSFEETQRSNPRSYISRKNIVLRQRNHLAKNRIPDSFIPYYTGKYCEYTDSNEMVHEMRVNAVAGCLSKYCRMSDVADPHRGLAYRAGFKYLASHEAFEDAVGDERWMPNVLLL